MAKISDDQLKDIFERVKAARAVICNDYLADCHDADLQGDFLAAIGSNFLTQGRVCLECASNSDFAATILYRHADAAATKLKKKGS